MKNLLKTISLVILLTISLCSYGEEVSIGYTKDGIEESVNPKEKAIVAQSDSKQTLRQDKDLRSCNLNDKTACRMFNYLKNKSTFKDYQILAIITSAYRESTLNPKAGTTQYGLFQWDLHRLKVYGKIFHRNIKGASIEQQIDFFLWELKHTETKANVALLNSNNFQQANIAMVRKFERSKNQQSDINKQNRIYRKLKI